MKKEIKTSVAATEMKLLQSISARNSLPGILISPVNRTVTFTHDPSKQEVNIDDHKSQSLSVSPSPLKAIS